MTVPRDFDSFAMSPLAREDMAFQSDMSYYAHPPNKRTLSEDSSLFFGLNNGKHQKMDSEGAIPIESTAWPFFSDYFEDSGIVPTIDFDIDQLSFASGIVPNHIGIVPQTEGINPLQLCQPMMSEDMPSVPQIKTESPEDDEHTSPVFSDTDDDSDNSLSSPSLPLTASTSRPEQYRQKHTERLPPINRRTASSGTIARYKAKKKETKTNAERRCRAFQKENLVRFRDAQILPEEVFQFVSHHTDRDSRLPLALLLAQEVQRLEERKQPSEAFDDRFYKTGGLSSYVLDATGTRKTHKLDEDIQHHLKSAESLPRDLLRSIRDHLNQYSRLPADRQQQYLQQFDLMKLRSSMDAYPKNGWATNMKYRADYQFFRAFLDNRYPKKADNLDAASCLRRVQPEFKATAKIISFLYIQYLVKN